MGFAKGQIGAIAIPTGGGPKAVHEGIRVSNMLSKKQKDRPIIIPSGKIGVSKLVAEEVGPGVNAEVMATQIREYGVPKEKIVVEDKSTNTKEIADNVGKILTKRGITNSAAVVETVHTPRFFATYINSNPDVGLFIRPVSEDRDHIASITPDISGFPYDWSYRVSEIASMHKYSEEGIGPTNVEGIMSYLRRLLKDDNDKLSHYEEIYRNVAEEWNNTHEEVVSKASSLRYR